MYVKTTFEYAHNMDNNLENQKNVYIENEGFLCHIVKTNKYSITLECRKRICRK